MTAVDSTLRSHYDRYYEGGPSGWRRLGGALAYGTKLIALRAAPALATRVFTYHGALLCRRLAPPCAS